MTLQKIVIIGYWGGCAFCLFLLAILTHSLIDLFLASAFVYSLLRCYPVFKYEEKKNGTNV